MAWHGSRNLYDVIDRVLSVIPADFEHIVIVASKLSDIQCDCLWKAPEQRSVHWRDTAEILQEYIPCIDPTLRWQLEVVSIWLDTPVIDGPPVATE